MILCFIFLYFDIKSLNLRFERWFSGYNKYYRYEDMYFVFRKYVRWFIIDYNIDFVGFNVLLWYCCGKFLNIIS